MGKGLEVDYNASVPALVELFIRKVTVGRYMNMSSATIDLTRDFNPRPFGRYRDIDGERSAEVFRDDKLIPAMKQHDRVVVDLSGFNYYGSSFMEEVFGGLVRAGYTPDQLKDKLEVVHHQLPSYIEEAKLYIRDEGERQAKGKR